ncbi:MAG: tRNA (adenosine(37)-N6)-threonylcarbamoyltransferase complex dimerization subunit type 1 TsaB [Bacteroidetes bacterium]|nr:tRNA (adenosine(37)-N6)-threonylcarbamoyltransferase complex dimerization subunit type 1 TsaB [Bacteroidota bacterium]
MILLIESSAEYPSVALVTEEGVLVHSEVGDAVQSHAELLPMMVQRAVSIANGEQGIFAVGFHEGPGSYTGLRIGVSLAKGICYALGVPLISVSGFEALGLEVLKNEVYSAKLDRVMNQGSDLEYRVSAPVSAMILPDASLGDPDETTCFVGNANEKVARLVSHKGSMFLDISPRAEHLTALAIAKFKSKDWVDLAYYEPYYLKDFVAGIGKKFGL